MSPIDVEGRVLFAEVLRPDDGATQVERGDLTGAEPDEETLAVGDGSRTREVVLFVEVREGPPRLDTVFPEAAAVGLVEGFDDEEDRLGAGRLPRRDGPRSASRARPARRRRGPVADAIRPSCAHGPPATSRRSGRPRRSETRSPPPKRRAPRDVLARAPRGRQTRLGRHAEPGWSAPLRPVSRHRRRGDERQERNKRRAHRVTHSATEHDKRVSNP